jgi:hypothetical protein
LLDPGRTEAPSNKSSSTHLEANKTPKDTLAMVTMAKNRPVDMVYQFCKTEFAKKGISTLGKLELIAD